MSFIIRAAFWLTVLAFLLPAAGYDQASRRPGTDGLSAAAYGNEASPRDAQPDINAGEMLSLATRSAEDVMGFCGRNADVCERSHAVVAHVAHQTAYYGSKLFLWLTETAHEEQESAPAEAASAPSAPHAIPPAHLPGV
jgi:hypothetical protein